MMIIHICKHPQTLSLKFLLLFFKIALMNQWKQFPFLVKPMGVSGTSDKSSIDKYSWYLLDKQDQVSPCVSSRGPFHTKMTGAHSLGSVMGQVPH